MTVVNTTALSDVTKQAILQWVHDGDPEEKHEMYFYASMKGVLFFKDWDIENTSDFWLAMFGLFILGLLSEIVKSFRGCLVTEAAIDARNSEAKPILGGDQPRSYWEKCCVHGVLTIMYVVETVMMLLLMLTFMTYNVNFISAALLGVTIGYFLFGYSRVQAHSHN